MIISASRRTDIPAFYGDWFINRLREGLVYVRNPFNANQISKIILSPDLIECIVFWTKNLANFIKYLDEIDKSGFKYYFQFTITSYDKNLEENVPKKKYIIDIFKKLSDRIGPEKVIWRYDPILITDKYNTEYHFKWFEFISKNLSGYTHKCVISFIDMYKKCERNLRGFNIYQITSLQKRRIAKTIYEIAQSYNLVVESCAEKIDLEKEGIKHGKCIDDRLISKITGKVICLKKDKSQRPECGCVTSVDIGAYNTCRHGCKYCYANYNKTMVERNCALHDKKSPLLIGNITGKERIIEKNSKKNFKHQLLLF
jgi:DNA repair photolyase